MRTNLALLNILNNRRQTLLSLAGIGTAILLIFMQLGFRGAVEHTATNIYEKLDFDLLLQSPDYLHFFDAGWLEDRTLEDVGSLPGVASVNFLDVSLGNWRNTENGQLQGLLLMGIDPARSPFVENLVNAEVNRLSNPEVVLMDRRSHRDFGPRNGRRFSDLDLGRWGEIGDKAVQVAGTFELGAGLAANGAAILSERGFVRLVRAARPHHVSLGLVKLESTQDPQVWRQQWQTRYRGSARDSDAAEPASPGASSVQILTREEVLARERQRWLGETPIGFIFNLGVSISFLVGAAIVYMVLGNDVADRLPEYATLRAMGYSGGYLSQIVLRQAFYLAVFSFLPATALALGMYALTGWLANIELSMTGPRLLAVLGLTLLMCGLSGVLALKKLWQLDPAELF